MNLVVDTQLNFFIFVNKHVFNSYCEIELKSKIRSKVIEIHVNQELNNLYLKISQDFYNFKQCTYQIEIMFFLLIINLVFNIFVNFDSMYKVKKIAIDIGKSTSRLKKENGQNLNRL